MNKDINGLIHLDQRKRIGTVQEIHYRDQNKGSYWLNKIVFLGGFVAQEKEPSMSPTGSNFTKGMTCLFEITHPARESVPGKYDWVSFISFYSGNSVNENDSVCNGPSDQKGRILPLSQNPELMSFVLDQRDILILSQSSMSLAVQQMSAAGIISTPEVSEKAREIMTAVVDNANWFLKNKQHV